MKKYFVTENWELEEIEDTSDLFVLVIEQNLPDCSYAYKYDTSPEPLMHAYDSLVSQYNDTELAGPLNICIAKLIKI